MRSLWWSLTGCRPTGWLSVTVALLFVLEATPAWSAYSPPLECIATSDLDRVFEDGYGALEPRQSTLNLFALRNETVSAQCVVLARSDLEGLTVSVSPLQQAQGSAVIPEQNVHWNFVGGIFIKENSPNRQSQDLLRPAPAWFPDFLSDDRTCSIRQGTRKAVYLTLHIPPDAPAGEYRAAVTATVGAHSASLPVVLRVYPLVLPEKRHLLVTEWFSTSEFRKHHQLDPADDERFFRLLKVYAGNMVEHRQNVFRLGLDSIECYLADGKLCRARSRRADPGGPEPSLFMA